MKRIVRVIIISFFLISVLNSRNIVLGKETIRPKLTVKTINDGTGVRIKVGKIKELEKVDYYIYFIDEERIKYLPDWENGYQTIAYIENTEEKEVWASANHVKTTKKYFYFEIPYLPEGKYTFGVSAYKIDNNPEKEQTFDSKVKTIQIKVNKKNDIELPV